MSGSSQFDLIQDQGGNHGNFVQAQNLIYMYGYDSLGHPESAAWSLNSSQRYSGGVSYLSGRNVYCVCTKHTDPQVDGVTNVIDVVLTVNVAFKGATPVFDDGCPYERTDVDCTGFTNVLDVVKMVNVAFKGLTAASQFCDGCSD